MNRTPAPESTVEIPRLLHIPVAADAIGISERAMYLLTYKREIRSIKIGRTVLVPAEALSEYIAAHTREATR